MGFSHPPDNGGQGFIPFRLAPFAVRALDHGMAQALTGVPERVEASLAAKAAVVRPAVGEQAFDLDEVVSTDYGGSGAEPAALRTDGVDVPPVPGFALDRVVGAVAQEDGPGRTELKTGPARHAGGLAQPSGQVHPDGGASAPVLETEHGLMGDFRAGPDAAPASSSGYGP
jgi:hypothetical protein